MAKIKETLQGENGEFSSKRVIAFIAFILLSAAFVVDLFYELDIDPELINAMVWIIGVGLGITGAEKFSKHRRVGANNHIHRGAQAGKSKDQEPEEPEIKTKEVYDNTEDTGLS